MLPYVKACAQKYRDRGLVVIGMHAPEFAFERNIDIWARTIFIRSPSACRTGATSNLRCLQSDPRGRCNRG
ncbi:hypothetical protein GNZ12_14300 [Paraburkholderia sp. 1N]|uniref:Uncharacterized protein n=1 Tax=Paraburkholderia solitsugae TaxID=2675748 RepID=A0ABX2BNX4_9BURK|nr:hypothetical protein [Paraburkholderia solitsugae]